MQKLLLKLSANSTTTLLANILKAISWPMVMVLANTAWAPKKITPIVLEEHRGKLNELVKNQSPWHYGFNSKLEEGSRKHVSSGLLLSDNIKRLVDTLDLNEMFKKMGLLEEACGKPQYFEWALTSGECKPEYWITQISDVEVVRDMYNFSGIGNVLIEGNEAVGTGKLGSTRIAYCRSMDSLPALRKFNRANENYILVFSGFLTSDWRSMSYEEGFDWSEDEDGPKALEGAEDVASSSDEDGQEERL